MDPILGIALYIILWWLAFFLVLPIGVRNASEAGVKVEPGHDRGAPVEHNLGRKALWAAAIAAGLWALVFAFLYVVYYSR